MRPLCLALIRLTVGDNTTAPQSHTWHKTQTFQGTQRYSILSYGQYMRLCIPVYILD